MHKGLVEVERLPGEAGDPQPRTIQEKRQVVPLAAKSGSKLLKFSKIAQTM